MHPLQRLSADEIRQARTLLGEQGLVSASIRITYLGLEEPPKAEVLAFRPGDPVDRRVRSARPDVYQGIGLGADAAGPGPAAQLSDRAEPAGAGP